jgi:hypothetical protein
LGAVIAMSCGGAQRESAPLENAASSSNEYDAGASPSDLPYDFDAPPDPPLSDLGQESKWWEGESPCPAGSELYGGAPPEHERVGCKTAQGKNEGPLTKFHSNGTKREQGQYSDHFAEGVWIEWDPRGERVSETAFSAGKKHGVETLYFPGGVVKSQRTFHEGKRHGVTAIWDDRERKRTILTYRDGKKHGPEARYDIEGDLAKVIDWEDDVEVGTR